MVKKIKIYTEKQLSYKIYMTKKNLKMLSYLLIGLGVLFLFIIGLGIIAITSFGTNALKLMRESRTEIRKVVWPTRMETTQTFMIVFGAIVVLCLFFWGLESLLSFLTGLVLG